MNDPWSALVETLAGNARQTPIWWPERHVHRMMDDAPAAVLPSKPQPPLRRLQLNEPLPRYAASPRPR
jgi:hypothetical protein